ncbi:hypothetical protein [Candidatus Protochlamydia amoebophila]|uniref:SPOR domain-containing protein n=1 Tax=Protochlamydia amoebophila (strain UWE25) TaxID=264201 RepID=Q6MC84_PARUW|nr:hypothetical protein [Candidatus Protochlamydia amoebophila]CAF23815.1 unnamed protein product [Candidatus Protochlamydia amoebophila UWE25]
MANFFQPRAWILFFLIFFCSCSRSTSHLPPSYFWQTFCACEEMKGQERILLYRALIPQSWIRQDPSLKDSLIDTTLSICEFYAKEGNDQARITIHTFPINERQLRIPPLAQIERWKKQFEDLDLLSVNVTTQSHGGFIGLCLEAEGTYQGQLQKMLAWSMHLSPEYDRQLNNRKDQLKYRLMRADYTIKIVGPASLINKQRKAFFQFANSFELIEELPSP